MKPYGKLGKDRPKKHHPQDCSWYDCYDHDCSYIRPRFKRRKRRAREQSKKEIRIYVK